MNTQVNIRLPENLRKMAARYAREHGFKNVQELAQAALRDRVMEEEDMKETMEILRDKRAMRSLRRSAEDIRAGRLYTWEEMQESWKKKHAKK